MLIIRQEREKQYHFVLWYSLDFSFSDGFRMLNSNHYLHYAN